MRFTLVLAVLPLAIAAADMPSAEWFEERFRQLDRNGDGVLTREEAGNARWFDRLDPRGKGSVSLAELQALLRRFGADRDLPVSVSGNEASPGAAPDSPRQGPKILRPADVGLGRRVPDLPFVDLEGKPGRLSDYLGRKALVIALTGTSCPVAKRFTPSLARLEREFTAQGVAFLFVDPTASDSTADIRAAVHEHGLAGRYVHDNAQALATGLEARTSTEVFVLDAARTLVYRGAIDDQYGLGYALDAPREEFLRRALTAVLAGGTPAVAATDAPGCALDLPPPTAPAAATPTYHGSISRIVQANCVECHRTGGVAPFSLETYDDVRSHAGMMRKQVARGAMPPWFAAPAPAGEASHWRNDRSLSTRDKAELLAWLASPEKALGDPAEAPLPRVFPAGWTIGEPDVVIELPRAVAVKAEGTMPYQTLRVQTTFAEDKWVRSYEVQPGSRAVVHHVIVRVHAPGEKGAKGGPRDDADERDGFFAAYVPGNTHRIFEPGFAKRLPAGATVSFQMHYTPNGTATTDRTRLGLVFASEPPRHIVHVAGISNPRLNIPPGVPAHEETATITLPAPATLLSFMPHMHLRGKAARYEAVLPDGERRRLLDVPAYDFNWQLQYQLAEPITLPRGARLIYTAWYDNSPGNPANPDSTANVRWGPQTFDEMMLGYVEYYLPGLATP